MAEPAVPEPWRAQVHTLIGAASVPEVSDVPPPRPHSVAMELSTTAHGSRAEPGSTDAVDNGSVADGAPDGIAPGMPMEPVLPSLASCQIPTPAAAASRATAPATISMRRVLLPGGGPP
ncbi:hypothetical protein [Streptomyces sp. NPDC048248]|uniref:hypothetical protein n=1 Tax=Streptomyces sp. NPDC048248 TaxID=3365523 RepID=UPI0037152A91